MTRQPKTIAPVSAAALRRRIAVTALQLAICSGLLWYLLHNMGTSDPETFSRLRREPVAWLQVAAAGLLLVATLALMFVRWAIHLRILGLKTRWGEVLRLGLLGFTLDFAALGLAGSDMVRATLLARGMPGRRLKAFASVVLDRALGLPCFFLFLSLAVLGLGTDQFSPAWRESIDWVVGLTIVGLVLAPALLFSEPLLDRLLRLPMPAGLRSIVATVRESARAYRRAPGWVALAIGLNLLTMVMQVLAYHLIATSLPASAPTLAEQALIVPLAALSSLVPLPVNGLGLLDYAMTVITAEITGGRVAGAQIVAAVMISRLLHAVMAVGGLWVYLRRQAEVALVLRDD